MDTTASVFQALTLGDLLTGVDSTSNVYQGLTLGDLLTGVDSTTSVYQGLTLGDLLTGVDTTTSVYQGLTLGDLLTGNSATSGITLEDLLATTVPPATYQWQSVDLSKFPLARNETSGGPGVQSPTGPASS